MPLVELIGERLPGKDERWYPLYVNPAAVAAVEPVKRGEGERQRGGRCRIYLVGGAQVIAQDHVWEVTRRLCGPIQTHMDSAGDREDDY